MANTRRENRLEELGRVDAEKAYTGKGKRNLREEKHRIRKELKHGGKAKPWGTGPKPGTHEFMMQHLHKRQGKAAGSIVKGGIKAGKRFLDFIKTGKHVDKHGVKTNVPKAAERLTGKPHVDRVKKAEGGGIEHFGGGEKGKPHSSKEGRIAAGKQNIRRIMSRRKQWKTPGWKRNPDRKLQPYSRQPAKKGGSAKGPHGHGPKPYLHRPGVGPYGGHGGRTGKAKGGHVKSRGKAIRGGGAEIK